MHLAIDCLLGRQYGQAVAELGGGAAQEEAIDTARTLQRFAKTSRGLDVERKGNRSKLQVEIKQRRLVLVFLGGDPGTIGGNGAGSDAAARADECDQIRSRFVCDRVRRLGRGALADDRLAQG